LRTFETSWRSKSPARPSSSRSLAPRKSAQGTLRNLAQRPPFYSGQINVLWWLAPIFGKEAPVARLACPLDGVSVTNISD
jgi:hypothetical protein